MKKNYLMLFVAATGLMFLMSGCTKEQQLLLFLNGTWKLEEERTSSGEVINHLDGSTTFYEELMTFFDCNHKDNQSCTGTTKITETNSLGSASITNVNSSTFSYRVFEKSQLIISGEVFEIEEVSKKDLIVHPVEAPNAKRTYSKI